VHENATRFEREAWEHMMAPPMNPEHDDEEAEISDEELAAFKKHLIAERAIVKERMNRRVNEAVFEPEALPDEIDQASRESEQISLLRIADKERKLLLEIERAIGKFETGDYGICEGTGDAIGRLRLNARPWTRYSIHFKEKLERQKKGN
jgi:DnaK suppressor protein